MSLHLTISDTTLRDGIQMPGVRVDLAARMHIAEALESAGVRSLEIGFPGSGAAEVASVRAVADAAKRSFVTALCRPVQKDIDAACSAFDSVPRIRCGVN